MGLMELGFCYLVLYVFLCGVVNCSLLDVQPFFYVVFEMVVVECPYDVFWDVVLVVFPVDKHSLFVGERFCCSQGGCWRLLSFMEDLDVSLKDLLLHVGSALASSHPTVNKGGLPLLRSQQFLYFVCSIFVGGL